MSGTRRNAALGWLVWQIATRILKRKIRANRTKLGAVGVVVLVLIGGAIAARSDRSLHA